MQTQEQLREHELGNLLRYWRHERGKSQLDLSLETGISQRHLSFVESGRSTPSRDLLFAVSEKLDIPLRQRNVLLIASLPGLACYIRTCVAVLALSNLYPLRPNENAYASNRVLTTLLASSSR